MDQKLTELCATLREEFQRARRQIDMVDRFSKTNPSRKQVGEFISHMMKQEEDAARRLTRRLSGGKA